MNLKISQININRYIPSFKSAETKASNPVKQSDSVNVIPVYGDDVIRTSPAQLSLFFMHDFHGQNIRMERAYTMAEEFDRDNLYDSKAIFDENLPVDKLKVASGDMFLGENEKELKVVDKFLNMSGVLATAIGNHECDAGTDLFAEAVADRNYRLLGSNIITGKNSKIGSLISESFVADINGNRYGFIGIAPSDMKKHLKHSDDIDKFEIADLDGTVKVLQEEVNKIKKYGVNKIILLSHAGLKDEKYIAEHVSDIDVILGAHTHNLLTKAEKGENVLLSPKNEPVLLVQVGRDGEHVGIPNVRFDEEGKITKIQYNVADTDKFSRSLIAKSAFENILGKPDIVGEIEFAENPPDDIYAYENPHCNFIVDCLRSEFGTDIAVLNSANLRGNFHKGPIDTRDLHLISPFGNKMVVMRATEEEIVNSIKNCLKASMADPKHRPGILQVSGLRYEFSASTGDLISIAFVDKNGEIHPIDPDKPRSDKFYTIVLDDFCATVESNGMGLKHRYDEAIAIYEHDKDKFVADYLRKQDKPVKIVSDGRIKTSD